MKLTTYLNYGGNCEQAFRFYEQHLGARVVALVPYADHARNLPWAPAGWDKKVLHGRLEIGGTVLMASDAQPDRFEPMRSVYLSLGVESDEEAERVHELLAEGGEVFMPMQETFFAHRFSMLRDRFGTSWMIVHERPAA